LYRGVFVKCSSSFFRRRPPARRLVLLAARALLLRPLCHPPSSSASACCRGGLTSRSGWPTATATAFLTRHGPVYQQVAIAPASRSCARHRRLAVDPASCGPDPVAPRPPSRRPSPERLAPLVVELQFLSPPLLAPAVGGGGSHAASSASCLVLCSRSTRPPPCSVPLARVAFAFFAALLESLTKKKG
jgi:hypothetical protein